VFEVIDQENSTYNSNLVSEIGNLFEAGIKHHVKSANITYSITAYQFNITGTILSYKDNNGLERYHNDGSTSQHGIEWSFRHQSDLINNKLSFSFWNNGCLNNHRFLNYRGEGINLIGNRMPGVAPAQLNSGLEIRWKGISMSIQDYWMDRMPITSTNTTWAPAYRLTNVMAHYRTTGDKPFQWSIHAGVNNVFNTSYTSFYSLDAPGAKYYNPSAQLNFFAGFRMSYSLQVR
jgi:iron complex outermembrane receptor protein